MAGKRDARAAGTRREAADATEEFADAQPAHQGSERHVFAEGDEVHLVVGGTDGAGVVTATSTGANGVPTGTIVWTPSCTTAGTTWTVTGTGNIVAKYVPKT